MRTPGTSPLGSFRRECCWLIPGTICAPVLLLLHLCLSGYLVPVLTVEDALPPNLQQLEVAVRLDGMMSLIKLTHLTSLVLHDPVTPPSSKFRKVAAALNQLSQVQLHFT